MNRQLALSIGLLMSACSTVRYQPYTARRYPQTVSHAVIAYAGDLPTLTQAGGVQLGSFDAEADIFLSTERLEAELCQQAAMVGATHLVIMEQTTEKHITGEISYTQETAFGTETKTEPTTEARHHRKAFAIRVPHKNMSSLPYELRIHAH